MKYKGIGLKEFTSDKPVLFDPPKNMLCWDIHTDLPQRVNVCGYHPSMAQPVITGLGFFNYCAEIPERLKPRRATNRELAKWLARGNGEYRWAPTNKAHYDFDYEFDAAGNACDEDVRIRKWDDDEWHEPTTDYMGLEG